MDGRPGGTAGQRRNHLMRVLHLLHSLRHGGLERVVVSVANGLSRRGLTQGVCCLHQAGPLIEALAPEVATFVLDAAPNDLTLTWRLRRIYRRFRPNVVHTVDFCSWPEATLAALARTGIGRMHSFHGFLAEPPRRWRLVGHLLARRTHLLHAVSEDLADRAARTYHIRRERIQVIPNGVDTQAFDPARVRTTKADLGIPDHRFVCVTVASLTPAKNPLLLVDVAQRVGSGIHFVWVGDGPLREQVVERLRRCELTGVFTLAGPTDDVRPWLAAADAFVLPSDTEAAPLSALEAMAMQLPVVATRTGAVEHVVGPARAGMLVDPGDAVGLARCIARLRDGPGHRRLMGVRGRCQVVESFSLQGMLDRYAQAYETLSAGRSTVAPPAPMPVGG